METRKKTTEMVAKEEENSNRSDLPPRSVKHPSQKGKWMRIYYLTLLLLFTKLIVVMIIWGNQLLH